MPEAPELLLPRQRFEDRHPEVAQLDPGKLPSTLAIALGSATYTDYPTLVQSALSVVHEYSDSSLRSIVIFADGLIDVEAAERDKAYLKNYLQGKMIHMTSSFQRYGVRLHWIGDTSRYSQSTKDSISTAERRTKPKSSINLYVVLDRKRLRVKPDLLLRSERTSPSTGLTLVGREAHQEVVGESLAEINSEKIDTALVKFSKSKS